MAPAYLVYLIRYWWTQREIDPADSDALVARELVTLQAEQGRSALPSNHCPRPGIDAGKLRSAAAGNAEPLLRTDHHR